MSHGDTALHKRLERINAFLNERTAGEKYATVFYCLLERAGRLHFVNAGHCPPLIVRQAGGIESLDATAMPVGLIESAEFEVGEIALAAGDKIVIYTDGVTEAQNLRRRVLRTAEAAPGGGGASRGLLPRPARGRSQTPSPRLPRALRRPTISRWW